MCPFLQVFKKLLTILKKKNDCVSQDEILVGSHPLATLMGRPRLASFSAAQQADAWARPICSRRKP